MMLKFAPYAGQVLLCDFRGFIKPEMEKTRPVIVLTPRPLSQKTHTTTIVPLSTTSPHTREAHHVRIVLPAGLPKHWQPECWGKCDMLYTVSFARLGLIKLGKDKNGKRIYYKHLLDDEQLALLRSAARCAIGLRQHQLD